MPDARFFQSLEPLTVSLLAETIGGQVVRGGDRIVSAVAPLGSADETSVAFMADRKFAADLAATQAGCIIVPEAAVASVPEGIAVIQSREAQAAWARASAVFHRAITLDRAADPADVCEDDTVMLAPGVVVGPGARIGRGARIGANSVVGPGVQIGRDCVIGPNTSLGFALVGDRVKIYAGARIGEAGFGATGSSTGPVDIPQLGRVIIQDGVTIGANTCIDRGANGDTVIGENSKIDNLCMIGHNCVLGRNVLMAAHSGLAGSVIVGDNVMFGGQAGVGDHITIGDGARVAAGGGVLADIPAGETWSGYPAKPIRQFLRETIWVSKQTAKKKSAKESDG